MSSLSLGGQVRAGGEFVNFPRSATSNTAGDLTPLKWPPVERRKGMEKPISRRSFLKKSTIALGSVAVCDFEGSAEQADGSKILLSHELKESIDPHVIVKLYPGRSEQQKSRLAEEIVKDVVAIMKCGEESVSVAIEEIKPEDWAEKVYKPDILNTPGKLYKKPGYSM
jgi:4-oxalocrotonate tautomerase